MLNCIAVGIGGFFGSILRYLMGMIPLKGSAEFPVNTLIINVIGAFAIGVFASVLSKNTSIDPRLMQLLKVGFCGGFTTFSTFSSETLALLASGRWAAAAAYVLLSVVLGVSAVFLGQYVVR